MELRMNTQNALPPTVTGLATSLQSGHSSIPFSEDSPHQKEPSFSLSVFSFYIILPHSAYLYLTQQVHVYFPHQHHTS